MKKITILDTSVGTRNLGDQIIVQSVERELRKIFKHNTMFLSIPTHEKIGKYSHRINQESEFSFVAGTNLLNSNFKILSSNPWNINYLDAYKMERIVLLGVGWGDYQNKPGLPARILYNMILNKDVYHSVRDSYTKSMLNKIGIKNVINTGCPTMWQLTEKHCSSIPIEKSENVIFTLTDYRKDKINDSKMVNVLCDNYKKVYFWVQGSGDLEYLESMNIPFKKIKVIGPSLYEYEKILLEEDIEYVGTRLHAGIKALQMTKRTIIIGIDNRAIEKRKDFKLNVLERSKIDKLDSLINSSIFCNLTIDFDKVKKFKGQFE